MLQKSVLLIQAAVIVVEFKMFFYALLKKSGV